MKFERRVVGTLVVLLAVTMAPVGDEVSAQGADSVEAVWQMFVGNYELVTYELFRADGEVVSMDYVGRIMYDAGGNMSAIGMPNALPELDRASSDGRVRRGFAYFGTFEIDTEAGSVTHHLIGSPQAARSVGEDWVRYYGFDGDMLTLSIKNDEGRVTGQLTWKRY